MRFQALLFLILTLAITTFALPNGLPEYKDNGWGQKDNKPSFGKEPHQISNLWKPEPKPWKPEPPFHPQPPLSWTATKTMNWGHLPTQSVKPQPWKRNLDKFEPFQPGHMASVTRQPWWPSPTSTATATPTPGEGWGHSGNPWGWGHPEPKPEPKPWGEPSGNSEWGVAQGNGFGEHGRAMNGWKREVLEA